MELFYETSLSAYILFQEVARELNIKETPEESRRNGNFKRILTRCNKIIDRRYVDEEQRIKLKTYIENIFYQN
ncbi:MAG: hypothetical protein KDC88_07170 [Ignavibacteriae bacterium]|nr:hypothetical protein [Ignavibacteriota bacterium]MCB9258086.1 hypothetical protein [Ignavibacteriales bacterium]